MNLKLSIVLSIILLGTVLQSANVNVTTFYGKTGGIVGVLNTTDQVVNGRTICPSNPTIGCDFGDDPLFSNNGTTSDPSDDSYSGDLMVRTNDSFQATAGWLWNGEAGGEKEKVIIKGTLPSTGILPDGSTGTTKSYKWDTLPGSCLADESSISEDKQTMTCVRYAFDKNDVGTYSEDLPFNVIVKGETLSKTKPGDVTFEISAEDAVTKSDDTDGFSLTVTAAPRWNLQKSYYTYVANQEIDGVRGWVLDYKFYIEVDEVSGEIDNASALVGNESMGKDATFTFKDDMSEVSPNAKLVGCSFKGRYTTKDGYVGSADPLTYSGAGSLYSTTASYDARRIQQTADEREITCTQSGAIIDVTAKHIDATLTNYPKLDYTGNALPVNRGIAAIGSIYIFVPLDDVKPKNLGGNNEGENAGVNSEADGWLIAKNKLTHFDPITPTGNANFGGERESELDNSQALTLYYSSGSWDKYYRGTQNSLSYPGVGHISYYIGSGYRSGDGIVNASTEFSTWMTSSNSGGTPKTEDIHCDVFDGYRLEVQPIKDNTNYEVIKTQYYGNTDWPYRFYIGSGSGEYVSSHTEIPYTVEYANSYVDDSFLPSRGGDTSADVGDTIVTECTDPNVKWYSSLTDARSGIDGGLKTVTKIRYTLKDGIEMPSGSYVYLITNHKVRATDLKTGEPLENGDLIVDYATHRFNGGTWHKPSYKPGVFPGAHSGTAGDRVIFSGPKARIIKDVDKVALSAGDIATFNLKLSFTNDTGLEEYGNVKVSDLLPKGLKYIGASVTEPYNEPVIGTCSDIADINSSDTPCNDLENQILIWDLGERRAGEVFPDINYSTIVGVEVNEGTVRNVVKIESARDASPVSQRRSEVGLSVTIPASINIVKSTEENTDYPSLRERTTTAKTIDFVMDMRNGKAGEITDLDVIDILPFIGDADDGAIKFNDLALSRKLATDYHGSSIFKSMELVSHPLSSSLCDLDANGGVKYYYTSADPKSINIAPTVGTANDLSSADSIWCEGEGCIAKADVTAVRARGPRMEAQAICQLKVSLTVKDNLAGDNYSNSTGASATGITLPVLSNSLAVPIVGSSLGNYVWYDKNANGLQDDDENGISGVTVKLLDASGTAVKNPADPTKDYVVTTDANGAYSFIKLNSGDYIVSFTQPEGYLVSTKESGGNSATDSNIDSTGKTAIIHLGVQENDPTIDAGFVTPIISGNIFNDGDEKADVNGSSIAKPDGTALYATLLDSEGTMLASTLIASDGTYSFDGKDGVRTNSSYSVVLATTEDATEASLPENWNNTGENLNNSGTGNDGTVDGKISVTVTTKNVPKVDFGINKKPVAKDVTDPAQLNMGDEVQVNVPNLVVTDLEDTTPTTITIKTLPSNAKLYYNGALVTAGQVIPNFDNSKLTIDPDDGELTAVFTYTTTDKAGVESDSATVTMPFTGLKISGNLFADGNGNDTIDGTKIGNVDGTIYVTLLNNNGTPLASKALNADGSYLFDSADGIEPNKEFSVVLSSEENATTSTLPINWNHADGEHIGVNTGTDGTADGMISVSVIQANIPEVNFGINERPEALDKVIAPRLNPGSDIKVALPALPVKDREDGTPTTITIKTLASNGTLYYDGVAVTEGQVITNYDATLLTVDPIAGEPTVEFTYTTTDTVGVESAVATVTYPFTGISISGNLFSDGSGDGKINGTKIDRADDSVIYATLLNSEGNVIASMPIDETGAYAFTAATGNIEPNKNYFVVISSEANATTSTLPTNWSHEDGEGIGSQGEDAIADNNPDGKIAVTVEEVSVPEINFGINKKPVVEDKEEEKQLNPGAARQVAVPDLTAEDNEDSGESITISIKTVPNNGKLYYDGVAVVEGQEISDFNNSKLMLDPDDGDQNVTFNYTTTDAAGVESDEATVVMPFKGLKISGYIFSDGNSDETVNGTEIATVDGTTLFATLLDANGSVLSSMPINEDGSYLFENRDGVYPNSNYQVILSTEANSTAAALPENWRNQDGEHIGRDKGLDENADGMISVSVTTEDIPEVNFGINKRPVVENVEAVVQSNPGADRQVQVIDLDIKDNEDGTPKTVTIITLPTEGKLYYDGVPVTEGQVILNFDNSLLTVDPENGAKSIVFKYTTTDSSGWESEEARVRMPFAAVDAVDNFNATDDAQPASLESPTTVVNVLDNDSLGEGNIIHLLDIDDGAILWDNGTAVGSASINTQDTIVVPGEGVWEVQGNTVTFTAEDGFTGLPAPIYYVVEDDQGNQSNVAQVEITTNCVCNTYENSVSDSVGALNPWSMLFALFFISTLGALFARREFAEAK